MLENQLRTRLDMLEYHKNLLLKNKEEKSKLKKLIKILESQIFYILEKKNEKIQ